MHPLEIQRISEEYPELGGSEPMEPEGTGNNKEEDRKHKRDENIYGISDIHNNGRKRESKKLTRGQRTTEESSPDKNTIPLIKVNLT